MPRCGHPIEKTRVAGRDLVLPRLPGSRQRASFSPARGEILRRRIADRRAGTPAGAPVRRFIGRERDYPLREVPNWLR